MSSGWFKLHRKIFNHPMWEENREFSKFEAWIDILQMVSYKEKNKMYLSGQLCEWGRGQYPISISFLCERWNWTPKKVRTYLKRAEQNKQISLFRAGKWTMLTVCKYDSYQSEGQEEGQSKGNQRATIKESKESKELNIPTWEEFKEYALLKQQNLDTLSLRHKYDAWVELGWCINRKGSLERIINWKTTLLNTLQYIKTVAPDNDLPPLQKNDAVLATRLQAHMNELKKQGYTEEQIKHYAK